jgi:hypothetical protein
MSHGMLHHIESKYSLNCCIYFIWFEFETWFEFELKTLEKINRKANRNSLEIEKANLAQLTQAGPACARARADRRTCLSACLASVPSLPVSVVVTWARAIGAVLPPPPPPCPLSLCPAVPTCQFILNLPPTISPSWTRPRPHVLRPRLRPACPPLLSHLCPLPNPLALSLALPTRAGSSATAHRWPLSVLWPSSRPCPVQCHSELRLTVSCSGHPSVCLFPLLRLARAHRSSPCAVRAPPTLPRWALAPPSLLRDASASARGEQPARALNLVIAALFSARLFAGVAPHRR